MYYYLYNFIFCCQTWLVKVVRLAEEENELLIMTLHYYPLIGAAKIDASKADFNA